MPEAESVTGALKPPVVTQQYPLADAAKAYQQVVSGKRGKVVLVMTSPQAKSGDLTASMRTENH